jgi:hypothetical protein
MGPRARTHRLVTRNLEDELLVYDLERHKAYCLNRMAMQVFRHCDGETTIPDMARRIGDALGMPVDEQVVRLSLARLEKAHLLDGSVEATILSSRRDMFRTLGQAAVAVMPLVTALTVPTSAQAASPCIGICLGATQNGQACTPPSTGCSCQAIGSGMFQCQPSGMH